MKPLPIYTERPKTLPEGFARAGLLVAQGWTNGAVARNARGSAVGALAADAVLVDVLGALWRAWVGFPPIDAILQLQAFFGDRPLCDWNDDVRRTHSAVVSAFHAVARA